MKKFLFILTILLLVGCDIEGTIINNATEMDSGTIYNYNVSASNASGDSEFSTMDSEQTEENINPIADAGVDQIRYIISI